MDSVITYIILQFANGVSVSQRIVGGADYINVGRRIGPVSGAFTAFARGLLLKRFSALLVRFTGMDRWNYSRPVWL